MYTRQQIAALAEKWLNGTISPSEKKEFEDWYNRQKPDELYWTDDIGEEEIKRKIFDAISAEILVPEKGPRRSLFAGRRSAIIKWGIAAAVLFATTGLFFFNSTQPPEALVNAVEQPDNMVIPAPPSGVKAILTLDNGKQIYLDTVINGYTIMQHGGTIEKKSQDELLYATAGNGETGFNKITLPRASQVMSVVLSDGTRVWLNVESSLQYPVAFTGPERKVRLTGEAYFEVSKEQGKKFLVETAGSVTEVLGTHFNINAYKQSGEQVTLLEGAVRVSSDERSPVLLQPGAQAIVNSGKIKLNTSPDLESVMAWKNGLFKLQHADIYSIMQQLSQWYDIKVTFKGDLEGKTFSGMISRNTQLPTVLEMLSMTREVKFTTEGNTITVSPY